MCFAPKHWLWIGIHPEKKRRWNTWPMDAFCVLMQWRMRWLSSGPAHPKPFVCARLAPAFACLALLACLACFRRSHHIVERWALTWSAVNDSTTSIFWIFLLFSTVSAGADIAKLSRMVSGANIFRSSVRVIVWGKSAPKLRVIVWGKSAPKFFNFFPKWEIFFSIRVLYSNCLDYLKQ